MPSAADLQIGRLALPDGVVVRGRAFGVCSQPRTIAAEIVFNTAMTGYQEALTDPSYRGQTLVMTAPMIGNYGANDEDLESAQAQVSGFVVRERARLFSNHRAAQSLDRWLEQQGVLALEGVDTRAITQRLRSSGVRPGILSNDPSLSDADLVRLARGAPLMDGQNLVPSVSCASGLSWAETLGDWRPVGVAIEKAAGPARRVLALDCGAKRNIFRNLTERGCEVLVRPFDTPAKGIAEMFSKGEIDGLFISNGPGDPAAVVQVIATLRELLNRRDPRAPAIPMFGICLGHQLLSLAIGATTYRLKFGHRGVNQPVRNLLTGRVEITSQNHGYAVEAESLRQHGGEATHFNLNDGSVAGFRLPDRPVFAVQHHPEASPGPHDASYLFDAFVRMMATRRAVDGAAMAAPASTPRVVVPGARPATAGV